jgi:hypothetical protein
MAKSKWGPEKSQTSRRSRHRLAWSGVTQSAGGRSTMIKPVHGDGGNHSALRRQKRISYTRFASRF